MVLVMGNVQARKKISGLQTKSSQKRGNSSNHPVGQANQRLQNEFYF